MTILQSEMELLRSVPLFTGIDASRLKLIAYTSDSLTYRAGQVLCRQGEAGESAYVIVEGEAEVSVAANEGTFVVAHLGPGDIVGEIAILCDMPRTATVIATSGLTALRVRKDCFIQLLKQFPDISREVTRGLAERLARTNAQLADAKDRLSIERQNA